MTKLGLPGINLCNLSNPNPPTTSLNPCAAPERSTELASEVNVFINHGNKSSKLDSPIPRTIAPNARAETLRTYQEN